MKFLNNNEIMIYSLKAIQELIIGNKSLKEEIELIKLSLNNIN